MTAPKSGSETASVQSPLKVTPKLHELTPKDMERMNVPPQFWGVRWAQVAPAFRQPLENYLRNFDALASRGVGFCFWGKAGRGKTAAAVCLLKAFRQRFRTGYFARVTDLREAVKTNPSFDGDMSVNQRVREVDVLLLDGMRIDDLQAPYFNLSDVLDLVVSRGQRGRPTLLTMSACVGDVSLESADFWDSTSTYLLPVEATGESLRGEVRQEIDQLVFPASVAARKKE